MRVTISVKEAPIVAKALLNEAMRHKARLVNLTERRGGKLSTDPSEEEILQMQQWIDVLENVAAKVWHG